MTTKFLRNYRVEIDFPDGKTEVIKPPLNVTFVCNKSSDGGLHQLSLRLFNLQESIRNRLTKDRAENEAGKEINIRLFAGYANDIKLISACTLFEGSNQRNGADIVTSLTSIDGSTVLQNSNTSATVRTKKQSYETLGKDMPGITKGFVAEQQEVYRPIVLVGNTVQLAKAGIGPQEDFFIDNGQYYIIRKDQFRAGAIPVVSPATGLLNTPKKSSNVLVFTALLDPTIRLAGQVKLESTLNAKLDGVYKVSSINYTGQYEGGAWQQEITAIGVT